MEEVFVGGTRKIMKKLHQSITEFGQNLTSSLRDVAKKAETNVSVLWEGRVFTEAELEAQRAAMNTLGQTLEQVNSLLGELGETIDETRIKAEE